MKQEESQAHSDEIAAQHSYEDEMIRLTGEMGTLQDSLGTIREQLALKEKDLLMKRKEKEATSKEKEALEQYLEKIRPGCDFITTHLGARKANRIEETSALRHAKGLLERSPAFTEAEEKAHAESLGECLSVCTRVGEANAECKACLAKTSVPGYCAGHPTIDGCS